MIRYLRTASPGKLHGRALLRLDFNTEDEWRMEATVPTIKFLTARGAKVVILSHRGRPKGFDDSLSLRRDLGPLQRFLGKKVEFLPHFQFGAIRTEVDRSGPGSVFLLENLRFKKEEEANDRGFARDLSTLADYYVNDAFAVSHRDDASVDAITRFLPSYAGLVMEEEIKNLSRALRPARPLVLVIGGAKAHDKLGVIRRFRSKAAWFLLAGAAANTMFKLKGLDVGDSVVDEERGDYPELRKVLRFKNLMLPADWRLKGKAIGDVGPRTMRLFADRIKSARTIIWTGPLGIIEEPNFAKGSLAIARAIAANRRAFSLTGGGETVMFLKKHKLDRKFSFVSTGGGAMIDFLAGQKLPGIEALKRTSRK